MDIVQQDEIRDKVIELHRNGGGKTWYCGYKGLAKHYSVKEGGCTDWTGYAGSGKSELLLDILKNQSRWYGHKHLIHMPDAGTTQEVIGKLIHKLSGKQFEEFYYDAQGNRVLIEDRLTEEEIDLWLPNVLDWFKVLDPKKKNNSKALTPKEFWKFAVQKKDEYGIFSAVIDSWNYMRHDIEGFAREDKWLEDTLSFRNELAERSNLHFHTIIHPTKARKDSEGKTITPDIHSLKGGSEWGNNGKSIIIVDRDFESNALDVIIAKAKPNIVGVRGACSLSYDVKKGYYYEFVDGKTIFAEPLPTEQPTINALIPNDEF